MSKYKLDIFEENKNEENQNINKEKKKEDNIVLSDALIFKKNIDKFKSQNEGQFSFKVFKKFINKNSGDKTVIKKWKDFMKGLLNYNGKGLFQNIGGVIKAMKLLNKKDISFLEKVHLHTILKKNENIFNFITRKKTIPEEPKEYSELLISDVQPGEITSIDELEHNLETLKEYKKKDLPKEYKDKINFLFKLYLKQKNILIEDEASKYKNQLIIENSVDYEKYMKEENEKRNQAKEEENKKIYEAELKKQKEEKEQTKKILKVPFYAQKFITKNIFLNQNLPESLKNWEDDKFTHEKKSLCPYDQKGKWILNKELDERESDVNNWNKIEWCKAEKINDMANYKIILNEPLLENIKQGDYLSDCYFISAIGSLCSHKTCINKLFHIKGRTKENAYGIYFFINGKWKLVLVDDYFPYMTNDYVKMLCFGFSLSEELWVSLLEKAWAKIHGSYIKIGSGGECSEVFDVLTEAYTEQIYIQKNLDYEDIDKIWEKLEDAIKHKYMICIGSKENDDLPFVGITEGHEYTLIDIFTEETTLGVERIVKLRNPYGCEEYSERWSDFDDVWTDELKKKHNLNPNENDGIFHMPYEEMLKYFYVIEIAKIEPNYQTKICKIKKEENIQCQVLKLEIEEKKNNCYINLYQKNSRIINRNGEYPQKPVLAFIILAKVNGDNLEYIDSDTSISENEMYEYKMHFIINKDLDPGTYYIFTDVNYRYIYRKNYGYTITTYSEYPIKTLINVTKKVNVKELLKKVMNDYCDNYINESEDSTEDIDIYQLDNSDLTFPFCSLCFFNKSDSDIKIEVKIIKEEDDNNCCFYCDEKATEADETVIKNIKPNTFESFITMPFYGFNNYKLEYNIH